MSPPRAADSPELSLMVTTDDPSAQTPRFLSRSRVSTSLRSSCSALGFVSCTPSWNYPRPDILRRPAVPLEDAAPDGDRHYPGLRRRPRRSRRRLSPPVGRPWREMRRNPSRSHPFHLRRDSDQYVRGVRLAGGRAPGRLPFLRAGDGRQAGTLLNRRFTATRPTRGPAERAPPRKPARSQKAAARWRSVGTS